jgi:dTMP kinase
MSVRGRFLSIEGGEGVGKSTQIVALAVAIREKGHDVIITREPGGTEGAEVIRQLLLGGSASRWEGRTEALLFAAARSDHVERLIRPALETGKWVISDRFLDSSRAYQGGGSDIADADILELHKIGSEGLLPDRTLVLELPVSDGALRASVRDEGKTDRMAGKEATYYSRVADAFRRFADEEPARVRMIDASGTPEQVTQRLLAAISDLLI